MSFVSNEDLSKLPFLRREMVHVSPYLLIEPENACRMHQNESAPLTEVEKDQLAQVCARVVAGDRSLHTYPSVDPAVLRSEIANYLGLPESCVEPTCGSSQGISLVALACFAPGKKVAIVEPAFSLYKSLALLHGATVTSVPLNSEDYEYKIDALMAAYACDVTVVCSPNNPTGSVLPVADILNFAKSTAGLVVVDEAYIEFCPELVSCAQLVQSHPNVLVLRTMSKAWGLAGLRLGAMVGHPDLMRILRALKPPYAFSTLTEQLGIFALQSMQNGFKSRRDRILVQQKWIREELSILPNIRMAPSHGNFVCFVHDNVYDLEIFLRTQYGILIRTYGARGHPDSALCGMARVSVWSDEANAIFVKVAKSMLI